MKFLPFSADQVALEPTELRSFRSIATTVKLFPVWPLGQQTNAFKFWDVYEAVVLNVELKRSIEMFTLRLDDFRRLAPTRDMLMQCLPDTCDNSQKNEFWNAAKMSTGWN